MSLTNIFPIDGLKSSVFVKLLYILVGICLGYDWDAFLHLELTCH